MWGAPTALMRPTRRSKSDHSRMAIGLEGTSSATSCRAHRYMDLCRLRWRFLPFHLTIPSLRAVCSAKCGCVRPALCASSFRAGSNRSGAYSCPRARPHYSLLPSAPLSAPPALVPFHAESTLWPYPRAPLDARDNIVELDFADTSALSDVDAFERRRLNGKNGVKNSEEG